MSFTERTYIMIKVRLCRRRGRRRSTHLLVDLAGWRAAQPGRQDHRAIRGARVQACRPQARPRYA